MRRLALSVLAAFGLTSLVACGTGFTGGTSTESAAVVEFMNGSGQLNTFSVSPTGSVPLEVNGLATSAAGDIIPSQTFTWAARFVNPLTDPLSIASYPTGNPPNQPTSFKLCPSIPTTTPAIPILQQGGSGTPAAQYPGFTDLESTQAQPTIFIGAVPGVSAASYCILLQATDVANGRIGSVTVFIGNSP